MMQPIQWKFTTNFYLYEYEKPQKGYWYLVSSITAGYQICKYDDGKWTWGNGEDNNRKPLDSDIWCYLPLERELQK